jgi:hypothetical protein
VIPLSGVYLLILFLGVTIFYIFNEFENGLFFQPAHKGNLKTFQLPDTYILFEIPLIQKNDAKNSPFTLPLFTNGFFIILKLILDKLLNNLFPFL